MTPSERLSRLRMQLQDPQHAVTFLYQKYGITTAMGRRPWQCGNGVTYDPHKRKACNRSGHHVSLFDKTPEQIADAIYRLGQSGQQRFQ